MSRILYAISMRLSEYTSTRSISSSDSSVVSASASKIALDTFLRLSCRACSSCFCFACANRHSSFSAAAFYVRLGMAAVIIRGFLHGAGQRMTAAATEGFAFQRVVPLLFVGLGKAELAGLHGIKHGVLHDCRQSEICRKHRPWYRR